MSSVSSVLHLESFAHLNGLNSQRIYIFTPKFSTTDCIFKHVLQKFSTLFGPRTLYPAPLFGLGTPANATIVTTECHTLLLKSDVHQLLGGFSDMHILDGLGSFTSVLKVSTKIWTS